VLWKQFLCRCSMCWCSPRSLPFLKVIGLSKDANYYSARLPMALVRAFFLSRP